MKKINVSECFYSIQGEGQTMGTPAVFLRLGGCNLLCESKNWRCDTIEVWRKSIATPFDKVFTDDQLNSLKGRAHLIITGGEPLMHTEKIIEFLDWILQTHRFLPVIEIETNGTIVPHDKLIQYVSYWNVSPKLSSAGEQNTYEMRVNWDALNKFDIQVGAIFKFVISCDEDVKEVQDVFLSKLRREKIYFMPAGSNQDELSSTRLMTAEHSKKLGVSYSDRLHVAIWNMKTGV